MGRVGWGGLWVLAKFSEIHFAKFSRHFRQFGTSLIFVIFGGSLGGREGGHFFKNGGEALPYDYILKI